VIQAADGSVSQAPEKKEKVYGKGVKFGNV
jgi:hypothetical protein